MVALLDALRSFQQSHILVVGDLMLDSYTIGKAGRISPEAPVPVVLVESEEERAGGAGNVILNLLALGMKVTAMGRVGHDVAGETLVQYLQDKGCSTSAIVKEKDFITPVKKRVIADSQQVVRVDYEKVQELGKEPEAALAEALQSVIDGVDVVAISDYGKGLCNHEMLKTIISMANKKGIPVIIDPKSVDFTKYSGATLVKPNFKEAVAASGLDGKPKLEEIAQKIFETSKIDHLVITRSSEGITAFEQSGQRSDFPVCVREVADVTGAGDTVLAVLSTAMACGVSIADAIQLANVAAGIAIEHIGCATVTIQDLADRLLDDPHNQSAVSIEHFTSFFNLSSDPKASHFFVVDSRQGIQSDLIVEINKSTIEGKKVFIVLSDDHPNGNMISALGTLRGVSMVVTGDPRHLSEAFPTAIVKDFRLEKSSR